MSTHNCPVIKVDMQKHPDADALPVMEIMGYEICMRTSDWENGQLAVYIPADYYVPDTEPFQFLKPENPKNDSWRRTRTRKFRGRYSFGFLIPLPEEASHLNVGDNAMDTLGIIRYEPPENTMAGDNETPPEGFFPRYDIENYQTFKSVLGENEEIVATEKIHGANARFVFTDGRFRAGSRTNWKKKDSTCMWWKAVDQNPWIEEWCTQNPDIAVYGEVFGNVQNLKYGAIGGQIFFRAFDLLSGTEWIPYDQAREMAGELLQWAPELYRGSLDIDRLSAIILKDSTLANHMMEGCVIRPLTERTDPAFGRVLFKLVSPRYLEKN